MEDIKDNQLEEAEHKEALKPIDNIQEAKRTLFFFKMLFVLLVAVVVGKAFVFSMYIIPSQSMVSTLEVGDMLIGDRLAYNSNKTPQVGDIVTFKDPEDESTILIKRVIATEGQIVELKDGDVYVDGEKLDEDYTNGKPSYELISNITYPYTVPKGKIWVMGDNRTNSKDSRYFGAVSVASVEAKVWFRYYPLNKIGSLED